MVLYSSSENQGLPYEPKNTDAQYFEAQFVFIVVNKESFERLSKIYRHVSQLHQQSGTI